MAPGASNKKMTGRVVKYFDDRGYGFISCDDTKKTVFVHHSDIKRARDYLIQNEHVEFELRDDPRGPKAVNVTNYQAKHHLASNSKASTASAAVLAANTASASAPAPASFMMAGRSSPTYIPHVFHPTWDHGVDQEDVEEGYTEMESDDEEEDELNEEYESMSDATEYEDDSVNDNTESQTGEPADDATVADEATDDESFEEEGEEADDNDAIQQAFIPLYQAFNALNDALVSYQSTNQGQANANTETKADLQTPDDHTSATECFLECCLCDEKASLITFHPCLHYICCLDCSVGLKKCPNCKELILKKEKNDGTELEVQGSDQYGKLLNTVRAQEEAQTCQICMERKKDTVFGCGHMACQTCAQELTSCHMCRLQVKTRTRIYQ